MFSSAEQPVSGKGRVIVPSAKPIIVRTAHFSLRWLLTRLVIISGACVLIYWVGTLRFEQWIEDGVLEMTGLEMGALVFAITVLCWATIQCWKYFDPYPEIRISPGAAPIGASFDVEWSFRGAKRRLQRLGMVLEGREEVLAENKTGKQAPPQKLMAPFYSAKLEMPKRIDHGQVHVQLPAGLMPTFDAQKTRIVWMLHFESQIRWGDRKNYELPLRVLPGVTRG